MPQRCLDRKKGDWMVLRYPRKRRGFYGNRDGVVRGDELYVVVKAGYNRRKSVFKIKYRG